MPHNAMGFDPCDNQNHAIFNSMTEKRNNVQLRTGLFEACVPLPRVVGNLGFGPEVDLSLLYTPVVNNHAGLGDGWSFAFTTYHEKSGQLTLHTGEVLKVEKGEELTTPSVIARWIAGPTLVVERKDGRVETLKKQGDSAIWVPEKLTTDGYRHVALSWAVIAQVIGSTTHYQVRLTGIRNDTPSAIGDPAAVKAEAERTLVSVVYEPAKEPSSVTITFWPGSDEALRYVLAIDDVALRSVTPPEGADGKSVFDYQDDAVCGWLLTSIVTFDGLTETVEYVPESRKFPDDAKLEKLPCVSRHTIKPRGGGPDVVTEYIYSQDTANADAAYTTTVTEKAESGGRKTAYVYDSGHSMVSETTIRGDCTIERSFRQEVDDNDNDYEYNYDDDYDDSKGIHRTTETRFTRNSAYRIERDVSRFRANGTLASISSRGLDTSFVFEREGAFTDAYLIVEDTDTLLKHITLEAISGLNRKRPVRTFISQSFRRQEIRQEIGYFKDGYRIGLRERVRQGVTEGHWGDLPASGIASTTYDYALNGTGMTITTTDRRGVEAQATSRTVSILSGRLIREVDAANNTTEYTYDNAGRLASSTACKGSTYEEVTGYAYPCMGRMEITEPDGRKRAVESDGRDNVIKEAIASVASNVWTPLFDVTFDDLGRKSVVTKYDTAGNVSISETCTFAYDNWGQECRVTYSDGRSLFNEFDPILLQRDEWEGKATDKHRTRTFYNVDDSVCFVRWLDAEGKAYKAQAVSYFNGRPEHVKTTDGTFIERCTYKYDLLGRPHRQIRSVGNRSITLQAAPRVSPANGQITIDAEDSDLEVDFWGDLYRLDYVLAYAYRPHDCLDHEPIEIAFFDGAAYRASTGNEIWNMPAADDTGGQKFVRTLGKRDFDAWGRVTSITRAGITETMTYEGLVPVPKMVTAADSTTLTYEYIPQLGYRPSKVSGPGGKTKTFGYTHGTTRQSTAMEGAAGLTFDHDLNEEVTDSTATVATGVSRSTARSWSEAGRLLSETDATGGTTTYTYNTKGQRTRTLRGTNVQTDHVYDARGSLASEDVALGSDKANVVYTYDAMYRETSRTFTLPDKTVLTLSRDYYPDSRVKSACLKNGATTLGSKAYAYDRNGRLETCTTTGDWRPNNPKGKAIDSQVFTYDTLGNITKCASTFGTETCNSIYTYDSSGCRLSKVEHDHADYKPSATLQYDANGRLTKDASGKTYAYDWLGRLIQAGSRYYTYDGMDRLMTCGTATARHQLVHDGMDVRGEHGTGDEGRYFYPGSAACSIQRVKRSNVDRTLFELSDADGTLLVSYDLTAKTFKHHAYTAYGEHASAEPDSLLGFQGAYRDTEAGSSTEPAIDRYPLGQGYRWYVPGAAQFQAPDSESPFGAGGWHAYGYCDGDPANFNDPSGHFLNFLFAIFGGAFIQGSDSPKWIKDTVRIGTAVVFGIAAIVGAVFTGGTSLVLLGIAVTLATVSAVTGIVAAVLEESDPETAATLNWVSFGTGLAAGFAAAGAISRLGSLARQGGKWMQGVARGGLRAAGRTTVQGAGKAVGRSARQIVDDALGALPKRSGRQIVDDALGALPTRSGRQIVDDALGALPKPQSSKAIQLYERAIKPLKPYARDAVLLTVEGTTGALGNAGVFEKESTSEVANENLSRMNDGIGFIAAIIGRARNVKAPNRPRLRFR